MKKQPEVTAATKKAFVDAFCALYKDRPVETITIRALTERAGYNRSTFYQYFEDVYSLLAYLEDSLILHIKTTIVANIERGDIVGNFIASFTTLLAGQETYLEALLDNPNSARFAGRLKSAMTPIITEKLHLSRDDVRTGYILEFSLTAIISTISYWVRSRRNISVEELGALMRDVLNEGIVAQLAKYTGEPPKTASA